jgi:hypothetical protein
LRKLVEFPLEDGGTVVVEVDEPLAGDGAGQVTRGLGPREVTTRAGETFEAAFARVEPAARAIVDKLRQLADSPDEIQVEFGVTLSAQAGAIVAHAAGEANFRVTLSWKRDAHTPG